MGFKISANDRKLLKVIPILAWILLLVFSVSFLLKFDKLAFPLGNSFAGWVKYLDIPQTPIGSGGVEYSGIVTTTPTPTPDTSYAQKERDLIMPIYNAYIANRDLANYRETYNPAVEYDQTGFNTGYPSNTYRNMCTKILVSQIVNDGNLTSNSPEIKYFQEVYNDATYRQFFTSSWWWLSNASAFDCLLAASSVKDVMDVNLKNQLLNTIAYAARLSLGDLTGGVARPRTVSMYRERFVNSATSDSPIEEAGMDASFMMAAAKLLPSSGAGAITTDERNRLIARSRELINYSVERCARGCPFKTTQWLAVNHGIDPNPNYTLSGLTQYTEISLLYKQLGETIPSDLFSSTVKAGVSNIVGGLFNEWSLPEYGKMGPYITPQYGFSGRAFSKYSSGVIYDGDIITLDLKDLNSSFIDVMRPELDSSVPINELDTMNQYFITGDNYLKSYTYKNDMMYHFECDFNLAAADPERCYATYQLPIKTIFDSIVRSDTSGWRISDIPTSNLEGFTQYFIPGTLELRSQVYKGDRMWAYKCNLTKPGKRWSATCNDMYTYSLAEIWNRDKFRDYDRAGWNVTPPPTTTIDAISQYTIPGTQNLKGYILKGDTIWSYRCENINASSRCYAENVQSISSVFSSIYVAPIEPTDQYYWYSWLNIPPPTSNIDAFYQYHLQENPSILRGYIYKGDKVWAYECSNGSCQSRYVKGIPSSFNSVMKKYRWPFSSSDVAYQLKGVTDWGMDATFQNSAFSSIEQLDPKSKNYYDNLLAEQLRRGYTTKPNMPTDFVDGQWVWTPLSKTTRSAMFCYLLDGWNPAADNQTQNNEPVEIKFVTNEDRVNCSWSLNMLSAKNHAMAYLLYTNNKILKAF